MKTSIKKTSSNWMIGFIFINLLVVDVFIVHQLFFKGSVLGATSSDSCPAACITKINQLAGKTVTLSAAKEYFVPLGSGTNASDDWVDVSGASAYIDTTSYGRIKSAVFEATISTVGSQKMWVRLFNATDKHPVWYSEISTEQSGPILLSSPAITLDTGNKLYQVQMKTQLKAPSILVQSRVKIATY